ncbi:facilitated trehalose transporter Tret1-2 homolog isoform X2 [Schistocerca gregaria]|nr:facilitated trehalose transporter Tret1-2 homolog isoform X2 [Schistocerca gregaria]XP_049845305.1 facilitated trehalose transporter Tret1-2 homolog isoform X2 [Schistocerca gregaria]
MDDSVIVPTAKRWKAVVAQVGAGLVANFACLAPAMSLGFSAVALPVMKQGIGNPLITEEQESWIASLAAIATPFGCLASGPLLDRFGRKVTLLLINVPGLLGWLLVATAPDGPSFLAQLYAGRIFTGISSGMASIPATVYAAEIGDSSLRGMLVTWTSAAIATGVLIVYVLGYFLQEKWRVTAAICALFPVLAAVLAAPLPESPSWLASRGRYDDAEAALRRLRWLPRDAPLPGRVQEQLDDFASAGSQSRARQAHASWLRRIRAAFLQRRTLRPLLIMNAFFFFQQFSGIFVVIFYAVDVVREANVTIDDYLAAVLIGVTRLLATLSMSYVSKKFGRRPPAIVSGAGMTLCMGILATYLTLTTSENFGAYVAENFRWIPIVSLLLYILASTIGFLTLPWAMIGELFPADVRGLASGLTTCMAYVFSFVALKIYPDMLRAFTKQGVFFFYGAVSLLGTIYVILFLPETKNKTLAEIEEYFTKSKKTDTATQKREPEDDTFTESDHLTRPQNGAVQKPSYEVS